MRCFILSVSVCVIFGIWVLVTCRVGIGGDCPPSSPATPHVVPEPQLQGGNLGLADDTPGRERRQKERKDWGQAGALDTGRGLLGPKGCKVLPRAGCRASRGTGRGRPGAGAGCPGSQEPGVSGMAAVIFQLSLDTGDRALGCGAEWCREEWWRGAPQSPWATPASPLGSPMWLCSLLRWTPGMVSVHSDTPQVCVQTKGLSKPCPEQPSIMIQSFTHWSAPWCLSSGPPSRFPAWDLLLLLSVPGRDPPGWCLCCILASISFLSSSPSVDSFV